MASFIVRAAALAGAAACCVPLTGWSQTTESLSIAGVPPTTVQVGQTYTFEPQAMADGPLTPYFQVQNLPPWASFSWTGELTGTPAATDTGVYSNIVISIVAGDSSASLPSFSITVQAASSSTGTAQAASSSTGGVQAASSASGTATISWTPPTTNTDGSPLTDLTSYRIYAGAAPNQLAPFVVIDNGFSDCVVNGLSPGLYYFAMTAVNSQGIESDLSTVVSATL
jgi:hypothetical protein